MLTKYLSLNSLLSLIVCSAVSQPVLALSLDDYQQIAVDESNLKAFPDDNTISNDQANVTGSVTANDEGWSSAHLNSSATGQYGSLSFISDGSYTYTLYTESSAVKNLKENEALIETFTYTIKSRNYSKQSNLTITIMGTPPAQPQTDVIAFPDEESLYKFDNSVVGNVVSNDIGFNTASLLSSATGICGNLNFNSNGDFTFTVNSGLTSSCKEVFNYQITGIAEGKIVTSASTLTVTIFVNGTNIVNEEFYALDDLNSIVVRSTETLSGNVTANDKGFNTVQLNSVSSSSYGVLTFDSTGTYTYKLFSSVDLPSGQTINDAFSYSIKNFNGDVKTATLIINIIGKSLTDENLDDFYATNDVNSVTRSVNTGVSEVTGNVLTNDSGYRTSTLVSAVTSAYGSLTYKSDGSYTYTLFNGNEEVQALGEGDTLADSFTYQIEHENGFTKTAVLTITIFGAIGTSLDDVEIEPNNRSAQSTTIVTGDTNKKKEIRGHLQSGVDKDWFKITGKNEIIHLEVCPPGSSCFEQKSWVLYIFDADKLTDIHEQRSVAFTLRGDDTGALLGTTGGGLIDLFSGDNLATNHMYLNNAAGNFDESIIGIIDPCFGVTTGLDIGVGNTEKTYYVAISSPLARNSTKDGAENSCSDGGSVLLERSGPTRTYLKATGDVDDDGNPTFEETTETTTQTGIAIFPNSDDQYIISVTRTGTNPIKDTNVKSSRLSNDRSSLIIPELRLNEDLYSLELALQDTNTRSSGNNLTFTVKEYQKLLADVKNHPYASTFNPGNFVLRVPKYTDEDTQEIYSLIFLYFPAIGNQQDWLELIHYYKID